MKINKLSVTNFRNHENTNICFQEGINVIFGNNAQGKTNILEAITLFSEGKSQRCKNENEIIKKGENFSSLSLDFSAAGREQNAAISYFLKDKKKLELSGVNIKKTADFIGHFNTVYFSPDDLRLIKDGPSERRRFINIAISQMRPKYLALLSEYKKILLQRSMLLKKARENIKHKETLFVWNERLARCGAEIMIYRKTFIENLKDYAIKTHYNLAGNEEELKISYCHSISFKECEKEEIRNNFLSKLMEYTEEDIKTGCTKKGPHRDDIIISINNLPMKEFASQGQIRTAVLSLKLSLMDFINDDKGEYPVLLLDDIMSELDETRQKKLLIFLADKQVIITAADKNIINTIGKAKLFYVENGRVFEK